MDLAGAIREQYQRYITFHADFRDAEADTLTLWTLHTHAFAAAEATPYLLVTAPTPEAGKSKIIDVARHLVREPFPVNDPSPSSLFRTIEALQPTLFVDEADTLKESRPLRAVLNSGYRMGTPVTRSVKVGNDWIPHKFNVFCPKLFAGIAGQRPPITGATLSRCVVIPMRRQLSTEASERFYHRKAAPELDELRVRAVAWAEQHVESLATRMVAMPPSLTDRQQETWEPLWAIADSLGGDWPDRGRAAAIALSRAATSQPDPGTQIIADMHAAWATLPPGTTRCHTGRLAELRNELDERRYPDSLTPHELSQWLSRFGIHPLPNPFRQNGRLMRGYERDAFEDAFRRYPVTAVTAVTGTATT